MEIDRLRGGKKLLNIIKVFGESNESIFFCICKWNLLLHFCEEREDVDLRTIWNVLCSLW